MKTLFLVLVMAVGAMVVLLQQRTRVSLETAIVAAGVKAADAARLASEQKRMLAEQPAAAEMEALQKNHAELLRLRTELSAVTSEPTPTEAEPYPVRKNGSVFKPRLVGT